MKDLLMTLFAWTGGLLWLAVLIVAALHVTHVFRIEIEHHNIKDTDANP